MTHTEVRLSDRRDTFYKLVKTIVAFAHDVLKVSEDDIHDTLRIFTDEEKEPTK